MCYQIRSLDLEMQILNCKLQTGHKNLGGDLEHICTDHGRDLTNPPTLMGSYNGSSIAPLSLTNFMSFTCELCP